MGLYELWWISVRVNTVTRFLFNLLFVVVVVVYIALVATRLVCVDSHFFCVFYVYLCNGLPWAYLSGPKFMVLMN